MERQRQRAREETKEMNKWRIVTYIAIPLSFAPCPQLLLSHVAPRCCALPCAALCVLPPPSQQRPPLARAPAKAFIDLSGSHPEHKEAPNYPYMHIRHKDFPWGEDGLFEVKKH
eukprot:scaffold1.g5734.t1